MKRPLPLAEGLLLLPAAVILFGLFLAPLFAVFFDTLGDLSSPDLAGYARLVADPQVQRGFLFTLEYALASTVLSFLCGTLLAAAFQVPFFGRSWMRIASLVPVIVPGLVASFAVLALFERGGVLYRVLELLNIPFPRIVREPNGVGIVLALAWKESPMMGIVIGSALAAVPGDTVKAARTLGAGAAQAFFRIQVPQAAPGIAAAMILGLARGLGAYAIPNLLGPAYPKPVTSLLYEALEYGNLQRAYALCILLACLSGTIAAAYGKWFGPSAADQAGKRTWRPGRRHGA
ncbi:MAG TPA: ABC transporter permease subunit [Burkholderiaceae bacterium]